MGSINLGSNGTITNLAVGGLPDGSVDADSLASNSVANVKVADDAIGVAELSATGTASGTTYLRGDNTWATVAGGVTSDSNHNTLGGTDAGASLTSGVKSTAFGKEALYSMTGDGNNSAFGYRAMFDCTGGANTGIGYQAAQELTTGNHNTAVGSQAMENNTTGTYNTAIGFQALHNANVSGTDVPRYNVAVGSWAAEETTTGQYNVSIGHDAYHKNTTGIKNVCIGAEAGFGSGDPPTYTQNVMVGFKAGAAQSSGVENTWVGCEAGLAATTGNENTGCGRKAGAEVTTGAGNGFFGEKAGTSVSPSGSVTTGSGVFCLGDQSTQDLYCNDTSISSSDKRDKTDVTEWTHGLDWINKLKPVSYRWDKRVWYNEYNDPDEEFKVTKEVTPDGSKKKPRQHLGFLAQDVLAVEQSFGYADKKDNMLTVNLNEDSTAYGMKYERLVVVLTKAVQELSAEVDTLKTKVAALEAG